MKQYRSANAARVMKWRHNTKDRLIEAFGGECAICGYSKCRSAFDFHHLDPSEKETHWGKLMARLVSWERIVQEISKCVLLCANCHREVHEGISAVPPTAIRIPVDYSYKDEIEAIVKSSKPNRPGPHSKLNRCPKCSSFKNEIWACCIKCRHIKTDWIANDVRALVAEHGSYEAVGRLLSITGAAVKRQWLKEQR